MTPEARARLEIDRLMKAAGWHVCDVKQAMKLGRTLKGVEGRPDRYAKVLPACA